eukprot:m.18801 g.18801  ORF g.18801 m.18801 type:complete len:57 (+) comp12215_c0_seq1:210-380(+)
MSTLLPPTKKQKQPEANQNKQTNIPFFLYRKTINQKNSAWINTPSTLWLECSMEIN